MAVVQAPLLSLGASGSVAGALVFSTWKGRPYVRSLVKPANPKSGGQVGVRSAFTFLSQFWSTIAAGGQATWEDLADQDTVSPFNAYMKNGLLRNRNFLAPTQNYPPAQVLIPSLVDTFTATPGVRQITIAINDDASQDLTWGFSLYRSTSTGFTPAFDNLIAIVVGNAATVVNFVDTPLDPDTYYYDTKPFTSDAVIGALSGEINATVV